MRNLLLDFNPDRLAGVLAFGIDLAGKATVLLLLAWLTHALLGRRRVMLRSALWNGCVAGLLALPIAVAIIPNRPWPVRVDLPSFGPTAVKEASPPLIGEPPMRMHVTTVPDPWENLPELPVSVGPLEPVPVRFDWGLAAILAYGLGLLVMLGRLAMAWLSIARLRRQSVPVENPEWRESLSRWRERIGYPGPIDLLATTRPLAPLAFGWRRPAIVLPLDLIERAKPSAIDAILLHEMGHLQRRDYAWNFLMRLAQAIYWPLPLAWPLSRVVDGVRERACDAFCIYWTGNAGEYGETLVDVASRLSKGPSGALGLSMARSQRLGRRLMDLSRTVGRATCRPRFEVRALAVGAMLVPVVLLGPLRQGMPTVSGGVEVSEVMPAPADVPPEPVTEAQFGQAPAPKEQKEAAQEKAAQEKAAPPDKEPRQYRVEVVKVRKGDHQEEVTALCTLAARDTRVIAVELPLPAQILDVEVKLGDAVKKGQTLYRYRHENEPNNQEMKTSPIDGIVTQLTVRPGAPVGTSTIQGKAGGLPFVEVTDASEMLVTAEVPESFAPQVKRGQSATVSVTGFDDEFPAKVTVPPLAIEPGTRMANIHLSIPNPEGKLLPGMSGQVRLDGGMLRGVLIVPDVAMNQVTDDGGQPPRPKTLGFYRVRKAKEGEPVRFDFVSIPPKRLLPGAVAVMPGQGLEDGDLLFVSSRNGKTGEFLGFNVRGGPLSLNDKEPGTIQIQVLESDAITLRRQEGFGGRLSGPGGLGGGIGGGFR